MSVEDKTVTPLIESPFRERNPDVSRDGRWIAYQSDESGAAEVYVRPFPDVGKGKWQVSEQGGTRPVWAHNRKELFYLGPDSVLMSVTFEVSGGAFVASTPKRLGTMPTTPGAHRAFDVAGRRSAVSHHQEEKPATSERKSTSCSNWFEELKKKVP